MTLLDMPESYWPLLTKASAELAAKAKGKQSWSPMSPAEIRRFKAHKEAKRK